MSRGTVCGCPRSGPQATVSAIVGVEYKSKGIASFYTVMESM